MALRIAAAVGWLFALWSLGAAAALYLNADERLGLLVGIAVASLILHREIVALFRTTFGGLGEASPVARLRPAKRTLPPA